MCSDQLLHIFKFLKTYGTARRTNARTYERVWQKIEWLASVLDEITPIERADEPGALLPPDFFPNTVGSIDTVPVYVQRPEQRETNRATYSGKYKHCVVKFQVRSSLVGQRPSQPTNEPIAVTCDQVISRHDGTVHSWSGPHCGCIHDSRIWAQTPLPLPAGCTVFGDAAYVSSECVIPPFKRVPKKALTFEQLRFNRAVQWYRSTIEHVFGSIKHFAILRDTFRCRLNDKTGLPRIKAAFCVLLHVSNRHIRIVPRRDLILTTARLVDVLYRMDEQHEKTGVVDGTCSPLLERFASHSVIRSSSLLRCVLVWFVVPDAERNLNDDAPPEDLAPDAYDADPDADAHPDDDLSPDDDPPPDDDLPPAGGSHLDEKHSIVGGMCPRFLAHDAKRAAREASRDAVRGAVAWDVISAAGRAGAAVASVIADDERARSESVAMARIIRELSESVPASITQPPAAGEDDAVHDVSVDWKGEPRSVEHERPPPVPAAATAVAALPRRSGRAAAAAANRSVISAFGVVDSRDLAFSDDDDPPSRPAKRRKA